MPAESEPLAAVGEYISKGDSHDFGAEVLFSTKTSFLKGRAGGWAVTPKLVEHIGSGSTALQKSYPHASLELLKQRPLCSRESWCLMACLPPRQDVIAEHLAPGRLNGIMLLSSRPHVRPTSCPIHRIFLQSFDIHPQAWVGQNRILLAGGRGHYPQGQPRSIPWHVRVTSVPRIPIALVY